MQCPDCGSTHIRKNGKNRGKQNHLCVACSRQCGELSGTRNIHRLEDSDAVLFQIEGNVRVLDSIAPALFQVS
jgi:transposase-like protein